MEILRRIGWRAPALAAVLTGASIYMVESVKRFYPIEQWLFWRYVVIWFFTVYFALACLSAGFWGLRKLGVASSLRVGETIAIAYPLGVLAFGIGVHVVGLLGGLNKVFFALWPAALLLLGGKGFARYLLRVRKKIMASRRLRPSPTPIWVFPLLMAGVVAFSLIYVQTLSPEPMHFDARWYHIPLAENYAQAGAIRRFPEGWFLGTMPHFVSYLYTWAMLLPGSKLFDRLELCLHLEVVSFLFTLGMIPTFVRRLVPGTRARMTWVGFFLFPGIFLYDSNLAGAVDHIGAIFTIPIALALPRAWERFEWRWCLLFGLLLGTAASIKLSFYPLIVTVTAAFAIRAAWTLGRAIVQRTSVRSVLVGSGLVALTGVVITSQYWLRNWIWYGNPVYPLMIERFHPPFWTADADGNLALYNSMQTVQHLTWTHLRDASKIVFSFSFAPHDWKEFHGDVPVFGFLFTLTSFCLPFLRGARRLWVVYAGCMSFVFLWVLKHPQDRYLQTVLPWMVAATMGTLIRVWQTGIVARVAVVPLVGLQIVWGGDVPFFPTHNLIGDSPLRLVANFLASGHQKVAHRLRPVSPWGQVGEVMPPHSKALVHESPIHLGIGAASVNDQWQGGLAYGRLLTPSAIYSQLHAWGVTHLLWESDRSHQHDTLASDLAFFNFATKYTTDLQKIEWLSMAKMPAAAPSDEDFKPLVAVYPCGGPYTTGLYRIEDLSVPTMGGQAHKPLRPLTDKPYDLDLLKREVGFIVFDPRCQAKLPPGINDDFVTAIWRMDWQIFLRKKR